MSSLKKPFLCGVVEGFYGRPWTFEQRVDLFTRMSEWGMNSYLYAPKDDDKHRASWRELYSLEEADQISALIQESTARNVAFVYAIAPGLDITFSSSEDITLLKRKLNQISALGCKCFAVLFDDIDCDMCPADAKVFPSFAHAQVQATNDVFTHLDQPQTFLFCPTEYCASRAQPTVSESQYLKHLGADLHPSIDIMWTGPKVISKMISVASIDELSEVLRRPPVIWDNLHANDYDQRRLFLGPYDGRSISLLPKMNGILTNPNCEYGANYVPIHTLAQWKKCADMLTKKASPSRQAMLLELEGSADLDSFETSSKDSLGSESTLSRDSCTPGSCSNTCCERHLYDPSKALEVALKEWMHEFRISRRKPEHYKPVKDATSLAKALDADHLASGGGGGGGGVGSGGSMNKETEEASAGPGTILPRIPDFVLEEEEEEEEARGRQSPLSEEPFTLDDLRLLVDFFYLPHLHGEKALGILEEFVWLKENTPGYELLRAYNKLRTKKDCDFDEFFGSGEGVAGGKVVEDGMRSDGEASESVTDDDMTSAEVSVWCQKAEAFHDVCTSVVCMHARLTAIPNRPLLYDIYQYAWDAKETVMLLDSYIEWLETGGSEVNPEHEPHVSKGGITAEMQELLPRRGARKKTSSVFTIRPYRSQDKELVYQVCLETGDSGHDATALFPNYPNLLGDRFVGPYTSLSPQLSFVLEDDVGVCGYVLAALDSQEFYSRLTLEWLPGILEVYPSALLSEDAFASSEEEERLTPQEQELFQQFRQPSFFLPSSLQKVFPSHLHIDLLPRAQRQGCGTRMIKTVLELLSDGGSHGVHLEMSRSNRRALRFYKKLGFLVMEFEEREPGDSPAEDVLVLGKRL